MTTIELVIPHCTYTDPEVADVGLTPRRARNEGVAIDAYRLDLAKVKRAFIDGEEEGFGAIYTRSGSSEIAGALLPDAGRGLRAHRTAARQSPEGRCSPLGTLGRRSRHS